MNKDLEWSLNKTYNNFIKSKCKNRKRKITKIFNLNHKDL